MRKFLIFILIAFLFAACRTQPQIVEEIVEITPEVEVETEPETEPVVEILDPIFEIVSIVIIQAELVNTQFEAVLRIENPNEFDVELSSLKYELYGNGMFWADGFGTDIFRIPANSFSESTFRFTMNFINMNRRLLDDVIAMRRVNYIFKGTAEVQAVIPRVPAFIMDFDCSGLSEVKPRADR